jgi:hypothetical protein
MVGVNVWWLKFVSLTCMLLAVSGIFMHAQQSLTGATVSGTALDPSGAVISGAHITITNKATGREWETVSDAGGSFRFSLLPTGSYNLSATATGLSGAQRELTLLIGQAYELPLRLGVTAVSETVRVDTLGPLVDTARTQISEVVTPREVADLPLNGRNYLNLAFLVPGASRTNTGDNQRFAESSAVPGTGISFMGQRNLNNSFLLDGISANDDAAGLAGSFYSQEVIREFQVVNSSVAEFGRSSSGIVNIVTQSGTNNLHGSAYGFLRNQVTDATNPKALNGLRLPLTQSQYGASFGGPIRKDKTFYFANFEQTRQNTAGLLTIASSDVAAINSLLSATNYRGPQLGTGGYPVNLDSTNFFLRGDHAWNSNAQTELRYSLYDMSSLNARNAGGLNSASRSASLNDLDQTVAVSHTWTVRPTLLNETRFQYTRSRFEAPVSDLIGPAVNISGVASFGTATFSPVGRDIDMFEGVSNLTFLHGPHSIKTGIDYLQNRVAIAFPGALQGVYNFSSLANFQAGKYVNFQQAFGVPSTFQNNPNVGSFVEDEWRVRPGFTLNAGIRYDLQFVPGPVQTDTNNIAPRIGVAWDPWRNGKTVVRANYGLFYDQLPLRALSNALQRDGIKYKVAQVTPNTPGAPVFPNVMAAFPTTVLTNITTIDPNFEESYSQQGSLQVEQALTSKLSATVGYQHLRGTHMIMSRNINVPTTTNPAVFNLGRPDSSFSNNGQFQSIGDSWYDGMTVSINQRPAKWGSFRVSYTFSKALDDSGNFFFSAPQDNSNILGDKGRTDNDQRHRLSFSGLLNSPVVRGRSVLRTIGSGWLLSYIYTYTSPLPFNLQTGIDLNGDSNANDRPAGVGRNTGEGFGFQSLDVRLSRAFAVTERIKLEGTADAFNVMNHANFMVPNNVIGRATFGQPTLAGDPRQMQFGLRVNF